MPVDSSITIVRVILSAIVWRLASQKQPADVVMIVDDVRQVADGGHAHPDRTAGRFADQADAGNLASPGLAGGTAQVDGVVDQPAEAEHAGDDALHVLAGEAAQDTDQDADHQAGRDVVYEAAHALAPDA